MSCPRVISNSCEMARMANVSLLKPCKLLIASISETVTVRLTVVTHTLGLISPYALSLAATVIRPLSPVKRQNWWLLALPRKQTSCHRSPDAATVSSHHHIISRRSITLVEATYRALSTSHVVGPPPCASAHSQCLKADRTASQPARDEAAVLVASHSQLRSSHPRTPAILSGSIPGRGQGGVVQWGCHAVHQFSAGLRMRFRRVSFRNALW